MAAISQTTLSNVFSWMKMLEFGLKFVRKGPKGPINNIPALFQLMAWRRLGDKPLSEQMMIRLPTHICITRPQWFKSDMCNCWPSNHLSRIKEIASDTGQFYMKFYLRLNLISVWDCPPNKLQTTQHAVTMVTSLQWVNNSTCSFLTEWMHTLKFISIGAIAIANGMCSICST